MNFHRLKISVTGIFSLSLSFSTPTLAEIYFQPPKVCRGQPRMEMQPNDPFRFLSSQVHDQGQTETCGFHAGTTLLEALVNSQNSSDISRDKASLSVVHCMEQLGFCTKSQFESANTNSVPFLIKMRQTLGVRPFEKTVRNHYNNLCFQEADPFKTIKGEVNNISSLVSQSEDLNPRNRTDIPIPPFNIETWDLDGSENPKDVSEELFEYFKNPKALPLDFHACVDDESKNHCEKAHGINLIGVRKVNCGGMISYAGIFRNSWGKVLEEYDLEKMIEGMVKHNLDYSTVHPCTNSDCLDPPILLTKKSNPILHLIRANDADGVKKLHKMGADLNSGSETPLCLAAYKGRLEIVKYLVQNKANIDMPSKQGFTPLNRAATEGHLEIVKYLVEHGANKDTPDNKGKTPLYNAASNGHLEIVRYLVQNTTNIDIPSKQGFTPLNSAATDGHLEIVKYLVGSGANLEAPNIGGFTPLAQAVYSGQLEVVNYLIHKGANPLTVGKDGRSILDLAKNPSNKENQKKILIAVIRYIHRYKKEHGITN